MPTIISKISERIQSFDYFGGKPEPTILGKSSFKTCLGFFYTILLLAALSGISYISAKKYLDDTNPNVQTTQSISKKPPILKLGELGMVFYIYAFTNEKILSSEEILQYMEPSAQIKTKSQGENDFKETELKIVRCDSVVKDASKYTGTLLQTLKSSVCFSISSSITVQGTQNLFSDFLQLQILVEPCYNKPGSDCKIPYNATYDAYKDIRIVFGYQEPIYDTSNYLQPFSFEERLSVYSLSKSVSNMVNLQFREVEIENKHGFENSMFKLKKGASKLQSVQTDTMTSSNSGREPVMVIDMEHYDPLLDYAFLTIQIGGTFTKTVVERSYKTILETLSDIGGLSGLILIIFELLNGLHYSQVLNYQMASQIFGGNVLQKRGATQGKIMADKFCCCFYWMICGKNGNKQRKQFRERKKFYQNCEEILESSQEVTNQILLTQKIELLFSFIFGDELGSVKELLPFIMLKKHQEQKIKEQNQGKVLKKEDFSDQKQGNQIKDQEVGCLARDNLGKQSAKLNKQGEQREKLARIYPAEIIQQNLSDNTSSLKQKQPDSRQIDQQSNQLNHQNEFNQLKLDEFADFKRNFNSYKETQYKTCIQQQFQSYLVQILETKQEKDQGGEFCDSLVQPLNIDKQENQGTQQGQINPKNQVGEWYDDDGAGMNKAEHKTVGKEEEIALIELKSNI